MGQGAYRYTASLKKNSRLPRKYSLELWLMYLGQAAEP